MNTRYLQIAVALMLTIFTCLSISAQKLTVVPSSKPTTCGNDNGEATATPSGGTKPYSYSWTPSGQSSATAINLSVGTYTITVKNAEGDSATAIATIIATSSPIINISLENTNATVSMSGGTPPYNYLWSPSGQTTSTITGLSTGTYTVQVRDKNGCKITSSITNATSATKTANNRDKTSTGKNSERDANAYYYPFVPMIDTLYKRSKHPPQEIKIRVKGTKIKINSENQDIMDAIDDIENQLATLQNTKPQQGQSTNKKDSSTLTELIFNWPIKSKKHYIGKTPVVWFRTIVFPDIQITNFGNLSSSPTWVAPVYFDRVNDQYGLVNYFDLMQYSYFNVLVSANICTLLFKNFKLQADGTVTFYRTYVSAAGINDTSNTAYHTWLNSASYGINLRWSSNFKSDFNFDTKISIGWLNLLSDEYNTIQNARDSNLTNAPNHFVISSNKYSISNFSPIQTYTIELRYKTEYWINLVFYNNYIGNRSLNNSGTTAQFNNFFKMQIGAEISAAQLENLFIPQKSTQ